MSATVVPGEDLPVGVAVALVVVALLSSLAAGALYSRSLSRGALPSGGERPTEEAPLARAAEPAERAGGAAPERLGSASPAPATSLEVPPHVASPPRDQADVGARTAPPCEPILVGFGVGQAMPSERVVARLRELGRALAPSAASTVVIDGHADSLGSEELNLRLSKRRAESVAWVLENAGVPKARITSRGFGAYLPMEGARDDAEANRRVAIHVRGSCVAGFEEVLEP